MSSVSPILILLLEILLSQHVTSQPPTKPTSASIRSCSISSDGSRIGSAGSSQYVPNLKTVLVELQDKALKAASFYNTSAGEGGDKAYGQYYCRGDIDSHLCGQCIQQASQEALKLTHADMCPANVIYYMECTLRHDNKSMVGILSGFYSMSDKSNLNVSDPVKFGIELRNTMERLIKIAAYGNGSLHFTTGEQVLSPMETVYCLVQCSPDMSGMQCEACLRATYILSSGSGQWPQWAYMFYPDCHMRYSTQGAFYTPTNAPPPGAPPPGSSHPPQLPPAVPVKGKNASYYVVRAAIAAAVVGSLFILAISFCLYQRKRVLTSSYQLETRIGKKPITETTEFGAAENEVETTKCIQFGLKTIEAATNSFSVANKLGQGGFGIVYQGILRDGQDIAVKRLSKNSRQGTKEFKTEVAVVAKLQHRNLVQLLGCCTDGEEQLLVYEFLCNLSLDRFLFDETKSAYLTWPIRHNMIQGIARGLHYLHEDSRVKIVHRDLKTSNILLDDNLEPKIADFGMAKLVKVDQTSGSTTKVVGTWGYMSPEYALAGRYSTKSDVYSFGVIALEIVSGKSNCLFYEISQSEGLLRHAWRVWNEGMIEQLMDPVLQNNFSRAEAERCIQIGLLCVQDNEANRPTMHALLVMLNNKTVDLPPPFFPSHSSYFNKLSDGDTTQEGPSN